MPNARAKARANAIGGGQPTRMTGRSILDRRGPETGTPRIKIRRRSRVKETPAGTLVRSFITTEQLAPALGLRAIAASGEARGALALQKLRLLALALLCMALLGALSETFFCSCLLSSIS